MKIFLPAKVQQMRVLTIEFIYFLKSSLHEMCIFFIKISLKGWMHCHIGNPNAYHPIHIYSLWIWGFL